MLDDVHSITRRNDAASAPAVNVATCEQTETPRPRCLIVVARDQPDLWRHLRQSVGDVKGVDVVLDRRHGGRREYAQSWEYEQRGTERRRPAGADSWLWYRSVIIVHPEGSSPDKSHT